ncbi:Kelch repeat-containing protein [Marinicauda salina]|nr:kelch-like protein [Marinicauda salina]
MRTAIGAGVLAAMLIAGGPGAALQTQDVTTGAIELPGSEGLTMSGPWRTGPALDMPRAGLSAATLDGRIFAAGGAGVVDPQDDFEAYEPDVNRWRPLSPMPVGLERFGMAAADGRLWVAGGYSAESGAEPIAEMWSYDPASDVWEAEPPLPGSKAAFSLLAADGRLFAVGGEDGAPGVFVFDLESRTWSAIAAPRETNRRGAGALVFDGALWLIGGASDGVATARVDIFDPEARAWRRGPDLPAPRAGHAAAAADGAIHVFGGRSSDMRRTLSDHLVLADDGSGWTEAPGLPVPRTEAAAATLDGEVFLIGGGAGAGFFAPFTAVDSVDIFSTGGE